MDSAIETEGELTGRVIGAAIAVHRELGPGFLESVYESALCVELDYLGIPYSRQVVVELGYRGRTVGEGRIDLVVDGCLVVELRRWRASCRSTKRRSCRTSRQRAIRWGF